MMSRSVRANISRRLRGNFAAGVLISLLMTAVPGGGSAAPAFQGNMSTMWDLTDLYPSTDAWAVQYDALKARAGGLDRFKGTLSQGAGAMLAALDAMSDVSRDSSRIYTYASLKADEDLSIARNQERKQLAGALNTLIKEKT